MEGPDGALVEYAGNHPAERFNHVHLWQEDPFCAQLWYQKHLNAPPMQGRAARVAADRGELQGASAAPTAPGPRSCARACSARPRAAVVFGDVALTWYMRQGDAPLASHARATVRSHRAQRRRSRCLGRQAAGRRRHVPARALRARRHPRRDDRRPQPRSARAGRDQIKPGMCFDGDSAQAEDA